MTERWRIAVDRSTCIGSGICVGTVPAAFVLEDGLSTPVVELIDPDDAVLGAAESCPMEAITIHEAVTNRRLAPEE